MKMTTAIALAAVMSGCVYVGKIDTVNANGQALTSRSAVSDIRGSSNTVQAASGMEGGGSPQLSVPVK